MGNIFTQLIGVLNTVKISGEEDINKMSFVMRTLHQMESAANEPEGKDDG